MLETSCEVRGEVRDEVGSGGELDVSRVVGLLNGSSEMCEKLRAVLW